MPTCASCGADNPEQARFCMRCARPLQAPEDAPREVRKTVTVLFCDLAGSTGLGERLDPEAMRRVVGRYFEEMRTAVERHSGTVEKFIGDAVMAVFGIPTLHEDDALRAVRAASDMRSGLEALNRDLERDHGVTLAMRIGVNTGPVVAGDPAARQQLVTGDTVNVAARLEQVAAPGEILIGEATHRLVRAAVEAERVEPLELKGKSFPVPAFRLLEVTPGAEGVLRRFDSPMVGRERPLAMLQQALDAVVEGHTSHLFTLMGTAGVGKSRLVAEFLARLPQSAQVLRGRCLSYGEGITFRPVVEVVREAASLEEGDPPETRRAKIAAALEEEEDGGPVADRLAGLLGADDSAAAGEEIFWAVRRFLESVGRRAPAVVIIDDIHWAEPRLLDLIDYLADWIRESPVLLVCPARPELLDRRPGWGGGKFNATSVLLEPLADADCASLIDNLLGTPQLPDEVRARILEAAEGTPLFVEEMVSMLIDDGLLERWDGRWVPTGNLSTVHVPPTIHALLASRLDQLPEDERAVIECGSVEGKAFHVGALTALVPDGVRPRLRAGLTALARRELIRPDRAEIAGQEAFRFRHQLIRDAAYEAMPKTRRAELHERFAAWLEETTGSQASEYPEILGFHLEQAVRYRREVGAAGEPERKLAERAGELLADAGRRAIAVGDLPGAANLLERAVALLPAFDARRVKAMLSLLNPLFNLGELARAERVADEAVEEAGRIGDLALQMRSRVQRLWVLTDPDRLEEETERTVPDAIRLFERLGDDQGLAETWRALSGRFNLLGHPPELEDAIRRVIHHSRRAGDRHGEMYGIRRLAMQLFWGPTPVPEGLPRVEQLLEEVRGHRLFEANIRLTVAGFLGMQGRFDEARRVIQECRAAFLELGASLDANTLSFFGGPLELMAGRPEEAERMLRADTDRLRELGERNWYSSLIAVLGEALYRQGRYDEAYECTVASEKTAGAGDMGAQGDLRAVRAKVLARRGEFAEAERLAMEAIELTKDDGELDNIGDNWFDLGEVLRLGGRKEEAAEALRTAIGFWDRKGNVVSAGRGRELLEALAAEGSAEWSD